MPRWHTEMAIEIPSKTEINLHKQSQQDKQRTKERKHGEPNGLHHVALKQRATLL